MWDVILCVLIFFQMYYFAQLAAVHHHRLLRLRELSTTTTVARLCSLPSACAAPCDTGRGALSHRLGTSGILGTSRLLAARLALRVFFEKPETTA